MTIEAGMNTTARMWQMVSEGLAGTKLPQPMHLAIHALCKGEAMVLDVEGYLGLPTPEERSKSSSMLEVESDDLA